MNDMMEDMMEDIADVVALSSAVANLSSDIKKILHGLEPEIQGAILADLLSLWIAGHFVEGNKEETDRLRMSLLSFHVHAVLDLIPESEKELEVIKQQAGLAQ